ncbi:MAG: tetratricopeptide repeat protein [Syntrophales bacterium]|nr:tetratricopeptide repeat protein [Syntrophales bacterium]
MEQRFYREKKSKRSWKWPVLLAALLISVVTSVLILVFPEQFPRLSFGMKRVKNTFAFIVLGAPPHFYYLDMEKNGKDFRLGEKDFFDISYRDEFVIKDVSSDAFFGRGITIDVEGMGTGNDYRVLLKGIGLIDHIVETEKDIPEVRDNEKYSILVIYRGEKIGALTIRVKITPQDWLRYARSTENRMLQIEYLKRATAMNNRDANVIKMLAGVYLRAGLSGEAIVQYRNALEIEPDDLNALMELSKCYMNVKEYEKVIETSQKILRISSGEVSAFNNMALAYSALGQWEKAIANFKESLRLNPDNPLGRFKLGEAYEKTGRTSEAIEQYKLVLAKVPNALPAMAAIAAAALKVGNHDEAIKWYKELTVRQPRNASLWANLGLAYGGKGQWKEEVGNYRKSLSLNPGDPVVYFNLAVAYEKGNLIKEAAAAYQKVIALKPDDLDALQRLADMDMKAKRYEKAIEWYEKIVKVSPKKALIFANLGYAYGELHRHKESVENYEKAIKKGAKDPNLQYNLAYAYDQLGRTKEAIREYEKHSRVNPTVDVLNILAEYYMKERQYDNALRSYKKMTELAPKKAAPYSSMGYVYGLMGDTDKEMQYYKMALRYDPEDSDVYQSLGAAYEKKEMYADAYKAYLKAYELNPEAKKARTKIPQLRIRMLEQKLRE